MRVIGIVSMNVTVSNHTEVYKLLLNISKKEILLPALVQFHWESQRNVPCQLSVFAGFRLLNLIPKKLAIKNPRR
jgi:hypothetical protein